MLCDGNERYPATDLSHSLLSEGHLTPKYEKAFLFYEGYVL